jgi:hypothetical protein
MKLKLFLISLILIINIGFTFTLILSTFYQSDDETTSKYSTIVSFFSGELKRSDTDFRNIVQLLKQDDVIEEKTIMSFSVSYAFNTNSSFIFTNFGEGTETDTILDYITRKNWSDYDIWVSNITSIPHLENTSEYVPDYLIYHFSDSIIDPTTTWYVSDQIFYINSLLADPKNPNIPDFLEPIYYSHSGMGGIVVYKINI